MAIRVNYDQAIELLRNYVPVSIKQDILDGKDLIRILLPYKNYIVAPTQNEINDINDGATNKRPSFGWINQSDHDFDPSKEGLYIKDRTFDQLSCKLRNICKWICYAKEVGHPQMNPTDGSKPLFNYDLCEGILLGYVRARYELAEPAGKVFDMLAILADNTLFNTTLYAHYGAVYKDKKGVTINWVDGNWNPTEAPSTEMLIVALRHRHIEGMFGKLLDQVNFEAFENDYVFVKNRPYYLGSPNDGTHDWVKMYNNVVDGYPLAGEVAQYELHKTSPKDFADLFAKSARSGVRTDKNFNELTGSYRTDIWCALQDWNGYFRKWGTYFVDGIYENITLYQDGFWDEVNSQVIAGGMVMVDYTYFNILKEDILLLGSSVVSWSNTGASNVQQSYNGYTGLSLLNKPLDSNYSSVTAADIKRATFTNNDPLNQIDWIDFILDIVLNGLEVPLDQNIWANAEQVFDPDNGEQIDEDVMNAFATNFPRSVFDIQEYKNYFTSQMSNKQLTDEDEALFTEVLYEYGYSMSCLTTLGNMAEQVSNVGRNGSTNGQQEFDTELFNAYDDEIPEEAKMGYSEAKFLTSYTSETYTMSGGVIYKSLKISLTAFFNALNLLLIKVPYAVLTSLLSIIWNFIQLSFNFAKLLVFPKTSYNLSFVGGRYPIDSPGIQVKQSILDSAPEKFKNAPPGIFVLFGLVTIIKVSNTEVYFNISAITKSSQDGYFINPRDIDEALALIYANLLSLFIICELPVTNLKIPNSSAEEFSKKFFYSGLATGAIPLSNRNKRFSTAAKAARMAVLAGENLAVIMSNGPSLTFYELFGTSTDELRNMFDILLTKAGQFVSNIDTFQFRTIIFQPNIRVIYDGSSDFWYKIHALVALNGGFMIGWLLRWSVVRGIKRFKYERAAQKLINEEIEATLTEEIEQSEQGNAALIVSEAALLTAEVALISKNMAKSNNTSFD